MSSQLDQALRKYLFVIDGLLVLIAVLMHTTDSIVFLFHFVFVLLAVGAFYWNFRSFLLHSIFWVSITSLEVLLAVSTGKTQFEELIEIPLLCVILATVFMIASQRSKAQKALEEEHRTLEQTNQTLEQTNKTLEETNSKLKKTLSERNVLQKALEEQAFYDPLTKLPNRALLFDRLQVSCSHAVKNQQHIAVLFLDLDDFKQVNDQFGHDVGDTLLVAVAQRLREPVRSRDIISRLGGDEFIIVLSGGVSNEEATEIAARLIDEISQPFHFDDLTINISASIGIFIDLPYTKNINELIKCADNALYEAKAIGKSTYAIHAA